MTPAKTMIREMIRAQLLPAPNSDGLTADERRKIRNKLKAARKRFAETFGEWRRRHRS